MKFKLTILTGLILYSFHSKGQVDVHINALNLILFEASGSVEKGIDENISIGGFTGYFYGLPPQEDDEGYHNYFFIGPEVKYYIYPKGKLDRFFVGAYAKYSNGESQIDPDYLSWNSSNGPTFKSNYHKAAIGLSIGAKWVTKQGLIFGLFGGIDRNFISDYSNDLYLDALENIETTGHPFEIHDSEIFGTRVGVHIGYRFDKKDS